jgi:hypothetical protein
VKRYGVFATALVVLCLSACASQKAATQPVPPPSRPAKTEILQWRVMKLLSEQPSVAILREPPADLRIRFHGTAQDFAGAAGAIASVPSPGAVLGLALLIPAIPAVAAHEKAESDLERRVQAEIPDPIVVVQEKLLAALRTEPALGRVQWMVADCAGAPCPERTSPSIALRTIKREICTSWSFYAAELMFSTPDAQWGTVCLGGDPKPPSADAPTPEIQRHFDRLASVCAEQLVTALLGRGKSLPPAAPAPGWKCD